MLIIFFFFPLLLLGLVAYSTRVSNELGAGNTRAARLAVGAVMFLAVSQAIIVSSILFAGRSSFGYIFSNEKEVVDYATNMAPLVCLSFMFDSLQATLSGFFFVLRLVDACSQHKLSGLINEVLFHFIFIVKSGIARGCGWQDLGVFINLGAYYLLGIPVAGALGFWLDLRGKGLWIGLLAGSFLQAFLISMVTICTNWEKQVHPSLLILFKTSFYLDFSAFRLLKKQERATNYEVRNSDILKYSNLF